MPDSADRDSQKRQERLIQLLQAGNSGGYERVAKRLREARELLHEEIAHQIEPLFNARVASMPQETLRAKQGLARWVNAELRTSFGLALRCPRTSLPALLHADPGSNPSKGRFQIELMGEQNARKKTVSSATLPYLGLVSHPYHYPSPPEGFAEREKRFRHRPPPHNKGL